MGRSTRNRGTWRKSKKRRMRSEEVWVGFTFEKDGPGVEALTSIEAGYEDGDGVVLATIF